jgi:hypothetical protein
VSKPSRMTQQRLAARLAGHETTATGKPVGNQDSHAFPIATQGPPLSGLLRSRAGILLRAPERTLAGASPSLEGNLDWVYGLSIRTYPNDNVVGPP